MVVTEFEILLASSFKDVFDAHAIFLTVVVLEAKEPGTVTMSLNIKI